MMKDAKDGVEAAGPSGGDPARLSTLPPGFPKGLRVLVVDDDSLCLKVIEQMLRKCDYSATMCINGSTALQLLRERPGDFDLVLSDVYMPDMDGFKLLEVVGLEMDLPVIMMSSNSETGTVLRGVTHGAVDFLIKPVRIEELRNVWQHVVRRRRELVRDLDSEEHSQETVKEEVADGPRKRKELGYSPGDQERPSGGDDEANASKKPRVTWSVEMHQKFVAAVNVLGVDKAVPKKILEIMGVDGLTRENVASHLQKYRLYLKRVQGAPPAVHSHTPRVGGGGGTRSANTSSGLQPATSLAGGLQLPAQQQLPGAGQSSSQLQPALHGPAGPQGAPTASGQHQQQPQQPQQQQQPQGAAPGQEGHQAGQPHAQGPGGGPPGGPLPPFPGPLGPLGNGAMGLNPLLNPMGLNPMGLPGPMGLPSVSPLGMLPGMPGGQGMAGLPGPLALPGMGLNPLSFMASMGMGPLALPPNGMAGLPGGVGLAGLTLGGPNMGLGHHPGLGALTNGAAHLGPLPPGMPAGLGPSVTPPPAANPLTAPPPTTPGGAQPQPHNGAPGQGTQALRGQEPGGGGVQGGGAAASPDPLDPGSPDGLGLDLADLAEPLGDLMQSDGPGGADMAGLLGVRDMDTGFPDDLEGGPGMDPLLGAPDGKDPAMDDVLNYFLKG